MIVCICFFSPKLEAQQVVTGRITDAVDGSPVQNVQIYISNTSVGTTSNASGNYSITVPIKGSFEIVMLHIGYQPVFHKINTPQSFHQHDAALKLNIREIEEVIVNVHKNYGQKDIDLFWSIILGAKPSKNGMEVLNPEKVRYYLSSNKVLKASCKEPIEIVNHQMGYRIRYILQSFQLNYRNNVFEFHGTSYFEELTPQNSHQKNRWEKKRQEAYAVSIIRFIQALYREQIHEEGFLLVNRDSLRRGKPSLILLKDILQADQDMMLVNIKAPLFLMCYSKPVTNRMIQNLSYRDIWTGEKRFPIVELRPQQITIYSDGTYTGVLKVQSRREYIFGLSSMMPVEYGQTTELGEMKRQIN